MTLRIYDRLQKYTLQNHASCLQSILQHTYRHSYKRKRLLFKFINFSIYLVGIYALIK
ncbi:hypothetical protein Hanom_Chr01g00059381 [Helianthus anomalus]